MTNDYRQMAEKLVGLCRSRGMRCATAESCTGGGVGAAITAIAGASEIFLGGIIAYDNSVKRDLLGVKIETLRDFGAVSSETAAAMAEGARQRLKADAALSVTGIAGPGGGSVEKPVGLVWFGLSTVSGVHTESEIFSGNRDEVRAAAVRHALKLLVGAMEKK